MNRPKKENILQVVRELVNEGMYVVLPHAEERGEEREIYALDYELVLTTGWHEKRMDTFDDFRKSWKYAIRSQSSDERSIRVIVAFDEDDLLIITLIDLDA